MLFQMAKYQTFMQSVAMMNGDVKLWCLTCGYAYFPLFSIFQKVRFNRPPFPVGTFKWIDSFLVLLILESFIYWYMGLASFEPGWTVGPIY